MDFALCIYQIHITQVFRVLQNIHGYFNLKCALKNLLSSWHFLKCLLASNTSVKVLQWKNSFFLTYQYDFLILTAPLFLWLKLHRVKIFTLREFWHPFCITFFQWLSKELIFQDCFGFVSLYLETGLLCLRQFLMWVLKGFLWYISMCLCLIGCYNHFGFSFAIPNQKVI